MSDFARENEMAAPVTAWLASQGLIVRAEMATSTGLCDLVGCRLNRTAEGRRVIARQASPLNRRAIISLTNQDGSIGEHPWLPVHDRLVLVELKLNKAAGVFDQAYCHRYIGESYAALPMDAAERQTRNPRWLRDGVGLLGVTAEAVIELISPAPPTHLNWQAVTIAERFWQTRKRDRRRAQV